MNALGINHFDTQYITRMPFEYAIYRVGYGVPDNVFNKTELTARVNAWTILSDPVHNFSEEHL